MKIIRLILLPMLLVFTTALPGLSATASEKSCAFVNSYLDNKPKALQALKDIFGHDEQTFQSIKGFMNALPDKFEDGQVVEIANVGNLFVEHFIVLNTASAGNIYFRFIYEKSRKKMLGVKFTFYSDADDILNHRPMFQNPVDVNC
jgi:hypothetical protein